MSSAVVPTVQLLRHGIVPGYMWGLLQPSLRVQLSVRPMQHAVGDDLTCLDSVLHQHLAPMPSQRQADLASDLQAKRWLPIYQPQVWHVAEGLNHWCVRLQETAGLPVAQGVRCEFLGPSKDSATLFLALLIPSLMPVAVLTVLPWVLEQLNRWLAGGDIAIDDIPKQLVALKKFAPPGTNNRLLIGAAYSMAVPVTPMPGWVYQYGWGSQSRWFDSTFTDATSATSAKLARSKISASRLLQRAGLPVPEQVVLQSVEHALTEAARIGFPVVIKPADLDGGVGVSAGLQSEDDVRRAHDKASQHSKNLILEKHIPGESYRLGVIEGKLVWAHRRVLGGVTGDGHSTVIQLLEQLNRDPRRGTQAWAMMYRLEWDDEAQSVLAAQGLQAESIPAEGQFVPLRKDPLWRNGSSAESVVGQVHPDIATLAVRAASVFRLDIAGVDLLCTDITQPWLGTGAAICEINGRPEFNQSGLHAPYHAVRAVLNGNGRIPVVVVLTESPCESLLTALQNTLHAKDLRLGYSHAGGLCVDGAYLKQHRESAFKDGQALLMNPVVDAVVILTDGKEWLRTGLPFDRFDVLVLTKGGDTKVVDSLRPQCSDIWECAQAEIETNEWVSKIAQTICVLDAKHRAVVLQLPEPYLGKP